MLAGAPLLVLWLSMHKQGAVWLVCAYCTAMKIVFTAMGARFHSNGNHLLQQRKPSFAATETIFCSNGNYPLQQLKLSFAATEIIFSTMINYYYSYDTIVFTAKGRLS